MKIIDILNKIANGEEAPKKIKYKDRTIAIHFDKKYKKVAKFKLGLSVYYQERKDVEISLKELQAINKQVEELGWN